VYVIFPLSLTELFRRWMGMDGYNVTVFSEANVKIDEQLAGPA
jgi:hypothetical protein